MRWRLGLEWVLVAALLLTSNCGNESASGAPSAVATSPKRSAVEPWGPRPTATGSSSAVASASNAGSSTDDLPSSTPSSSSAITGPPSKGHHGLWLWEIGKNGPSALRAAEHAARWGVGRVFIKSSEGAGGVRLPTDAPPSPVASGAPISSASNTSPSSIASAAPISSASAAPNVAPPPQPFNRWAQNFSSENVRPFVERGIEVWAFGYFYPDGYVDPDGVSWGSLDAQVKASLATLHDGVTGLVVDAEAEFNGHDADAEKLCRILRSKLGKKRLAFTSFGWISAQRKFPFKAFDKGCGDAFLPQVYYDFGWPGGVHGSLDRMRKDVAALGLKAPVWPVQSNERNASVADMTLFFDEGGEDASIFYFHTEETDQTKRMGALHW